MVSFYLRMLWGLPWLFIQSVQTVEGGVAVILFLGIVLGVPAVNHWTETHLNRRTWVMFAIGLYFLFLLLWSNYDAFNQSQSTHATAVKDLDAKLNGVLAELKIKSLLNDQLTKENSALAAGGRVLTDAEARIEAVRAEFLNLAAKAPTKDQFTQESANEWYIVASRLHEYTIDQQRSRLHVGFIDDKKASYDDVQQVVGYLRSVAANITTDDLLDNTPDSC